MHCALCQVHGCEGLQCDPPLRPSLASAAGGILGDLARLGRFSPQLQSATRAAAAFAARQQHTALSASARERVRVLDEAAAPDKQRRHVNLARCSVGARLLLTSAIASKKEWLLR